MSEEPQIPPAEIAPVSLQDAQQVTIPAPKPDKRAAAEEKMFAHRENMQNAQLGWVGRIWGTKSEKPGNISAIIAVFLTVYLGFQIFYFYQTETFGEVFAGLTSIITLILGYLFGSGNKS